MRLLIRTAIVAGCWGVELLSAQSAPRHYCAAAQTQMEMNRCWVNEAKQADERLERAVKSTLDKTSAREPATTAQSKWQEYRQAQCEAVAAVYEGGSMQPMQRAACLVRLTDQRIAELRNLLPQDQ